MNIKLSLLITLAALGGSINAETILKELKKEELATQIDTIDRSKPGQSSKSTQLKIQNLLLWRMVDCIEKSNTEDYITPEKERIIADICFNTIHNQLTNLKQTSDFPETNERFLEELNKIGEKHLGRS